MPLDPQAEILLKQVAFAGAPLECRRRSHAIRE
jgi:hypothetical protein